MNARQTARPDQGAKVFVVQPQDRMDYSDAERFGELLFITGFEWSPHSGNPRNAMILQDVRTRIAQTFNPNHDYLIMTGNPITMGAAFHYALTKAKSAGVQALRILQWDRFQSKYREVIYDEDAK